MIETENNSFNETINYSMDEKRNSNSINQTNIKEWREKDDGIPQIVGGEGVLVEMMERKKRYDELIFEKEKLDFLKKTKKIRQNPEEYRNLIKCSVLCDIGSTMFMLKDAKDPYVIALILSHFPRKDLEDLLRIKEKDVRNTIRRVVNFV